MKPEETADVQMKESSSNYSIPHTGLSEDGTVGSSQSKIGDCSKERGASRWPYESMEYIKKEVAFYEARKKADETRNETYLRGLQQRIDLLDQSVHGFLEELGNKTRMGDRFQEECALTAGYVDTGILIDQLSVECRSLSAAAKKLAITGLELLHILREIMPADDHTESPLKVHVYEVAELQDDLQKWQEGVVALDELFEMAGAAVAHSMHPKFSSVVQNGRKMVENIVQVYQVQCSALTNKVAEEKLNEKYEEYQDNFQTITEKASKEEQIVHHIQEDLIPATNEELTIATLAQKELEQKVENVTLGIKQHAAKARTGLEALNNELKDFKGLNAALRAEMLRIEDLRDHLERVRDATKIGDENEVTKMPGATDMTGVSDTTATTKVARVTDVTRITEDEDAKGVTGITDASEFTEVAGIMDDTEVAETCEITEEAEFEDQEQDLRDGVEKGLRRFQALRNITASEMTFYRLREHAEVMLDIEIGDTVGPTTTPEAVGELSERITKAVFDFDNVVSNAFRRITESAEEILENKGVCAACTELVFSDFCDKQTGVEGMPSGLQTWTRAYEETRSETMGYAESLQNYRCLWIMYNKVKADLLYPIAKHDRKMSFPAIQEVSGEIDEEGEGGTKAEEGVEWRGDLPQQWQEHLHTAREAYTEGIICFEDYREQVILLLKMAAVLQQMASVLGSGFAQLHLRRILTSRMDSIFGEIGLERFQVRRWQREGGVDGYSNMLRQLHGKGKEAKLQQQYKLLYLAITESHKKVAAKLYHSMPGKSKHMDTILELSQSSTELTSAAPSWRRLSRQSSQGDQSQWSDRPTRAAAPKSRKDEAAARRDRPDDACMDREFVRRVSLSSSCREVPFPFLDTASKTSSPFMDLSDRPKRISSTRRPSLCMSVAFGVVEESMSSSTEVGEEEEGPDTVELDGLPRRSSLLLTTPPFPPQSPAKAPPLALPSSPLPSSALPLSAVPPPDLRSLDRVSPTSLSPSLPSPALPSLALPSPALPLSSLPPLRTGTVKQRQMLSPLAVLGECVVSVGKTRARGTGRPEPLLSTVSMKFVKASQPKLKGKDIQISGIWTPRVDDRRERVKRKKQRREKVPGALAAPAVSRPPRNPYLLVSQRFTDNTADSTRSGGTASEPFKSRGVSDRSAGGHVTDKPGRSTASVTEESDKTVRKSASTVVSVVVKPECSSIDRRLHLKLDSVSDNSKLSSDVSAESPPFKKPKQSAGGKPRPATGSVLETRSCSVDRITSKPRSSTDSVTDEPRPATESAASKPRHSTDGKPKHFADGRPRHFAEGKPRHTTESKTRHPTVRELESSTDGKTRDSVEGKPRHSTETKLKYLAVGKLEHSTDGKTRHSAESKPAEGKPRHSTVDKPRHSTVDKPRQSTEGKSRLSAEGKSRHTAVSEARYSTDGKSSRSTLATASSPISTATRSGVFKERSSETPLPRPLSKESRTGDSPLSDSTVLSGRPAPRTTPVSGRSGTPSYLFTKSGIPTQRSESTQPSSTSAQTSAQLGSRADSTNQQYSGEHEDVREAAESVLSQVGPTPSSAHSSGHDGVWAQHATTPTMELTTPHARNSQDGYSVWRVLFSSELDDVPRTVPETPRLLHKMVTPRGSHPLDTEDLQEYLSTLPDPVDPTPVERLQRPRVHDKLVTLHSLADTDAASSWCSPRSAVAGVRDWVQHSSHVQPASCEAGRGLLQLEGMAKQRKVHNRFVGKMKRKHITAPVQGQSAGYSGPQRTVQDQQVRPDVTEACPGWPIADPGAVSTQECRLFCLDVDQSLRKAAVALKLVSGSQLSKLPSDPSCKHIWNKFQQPHRHVQI